MKIDHYSLKPSAQFWTFHTTSSLRWVGVICTKYGTVTLTTWNLDSGGFEHHLEMYQHPRVYRTMFGGEKSERGLVLTANKFAKECKRIGAALSRGDRI